MKPSRRRFLIASAAAVAAGVLLPRVVRIRPPEEEGIDLAPCRGLYVASDGVGRVRRADGRIERESVKAGTVWTVRATRILKGTTATLMPIY